jgi:hypothetical protein
MNAEILRWWSLPKDCSIDDFNEAYQDQLFQARKEIRSNLHVPKLLAKKLETYQKWALSERPDLKFLVVEEIAVVDFAHFEKTMASKLLLLERCMDFESIVLVGHQMIAVLEGYRSLIFQMTEQWESESELVQVKSTELFPSGAFLLAIRNGQSIEDWKIPLLKERRRLKFVF